MNPVAVLYESYDNYVANNGNGWWDEDWESLPAGQYGAVRIYQVFPDGSRAYLGTGSYLWAPYGDDGYGYDGATAIIGPDLPRGTDPPYCILGLSYTTYRIALFHTQDDAATHTNPIEIDCTQELPGGEWTIHWAVRALTGGSAAPAGLFWTNLTGTKQRP